MKRLIITSPLILVVFFLACLPTDSALKGRRFLFLDHSIVINGMVVSAISGAPKLVASKSLVVGTPCGCTGTMVDGYNYSFDTTTRKLSCGLAVSDITDSLEMVSGFRRTWVGLSSGTVGQIEKVSSLPLSDTLQKMNITAIETDGTVRLVFKGRQIDLGIGQAWEHDTIVYDTAGCTAGCVRRDSVFERIDNFGWLDSSNIAN